MGGELFFYTLFLPVIGSFIALYSLWDSYRRAKEDTILKIKLDELEPIPKPKEVKIFGKTISKKVRFALIFLYFFFFIGLTSALFVVIVFFLLDYYSKWSLKKKKANPKKVREVIRTWLIILGVLPLGLLIYGYLIYNMAQIKLNNFIVSVEISNGVLTAGGIAIGLTAIGAGIAMASTNKEAVRGMIENPLIATWYVIVAALAEALGLYGLTIAVMIIGKYEEVNLPGVTSLTAAGVVIGFASIGAGIGIALTMKETSKSMINKTEMATWIVVIAALAEGVALYGLVISFMILGKSDVGISLADANMLYNSALRYGGALILSGFLVGYLPTRIDGEPDQKVMIKKVILAAIGVSVSLIALTWEFMIIGRV